MNEAIIQLDISFLSYWHSGSGTGRGAEMDALVLRDHHGLPYLPGRAVKGLLREGLQSCEDAGLVATGRTCYLLGTPARDGEYDGSSPGILSVRDACLSAAEHAWLVSAEGCASKDALFDAVASTSLDARGMAADHTLRVIELCVPLKLTARISGPPGDWSKDMQKACALIRGAGSHRNRGLGRCELRISEGGSCHV